MVLFRLIPLLALAGLAAVLRAEPQPGEIFTETTYRHRFAEVDPASKRLDNATDLVKFPFLKAANNRTERTLDLGSLGKVVRAELVVEYWGGHIGSSAQSVRVNGRDWLPLAQPAGTPERPEHFFRTLLRSTIDLPLAHLVSNANKFQFTVGPQLKFGWDWGNSWFYAFTVRLYHDPVRPHPTGTLRALPPAGSEAPRFAITDLKSPEAGIGQIDFIAEYEDYNWEGDGAWHQWHYIYETGKIRRHVGTATAAPWTVTWDTTWIPDQTKPIRVLARIVDTLGVTTVTAPITLEKLPRTGRSVRLFRVAALPTRLAARDGKESPKCTIELPADALTGAKSARLVASTWSGSVDDDSVHELRLNGERLVSRPGVFHNYAFVTLDVPLARLRAGANDLTLFSTYHGHAFELNWPGPALLIEY